MFHFVLFSFTFRLIGVAAVDATLEEIENILTSQQWGDVYSFLINKEGEAIFHPSLSATMRQNVNIMQNLLMNLFFLIFSNFIQDNGRSDCCANH